MENFVGIPYVVLGRGYDGADCWGLVYLFYRDVFGIEIPTYSEFLESNGNRPRVVNTLVNQVKDRDWKQVEQKRHGDVVLMRTGKNEHHVGIFVEPNFILHSEDIGSYSHMTKISDPRISKRIVGYFRLKDAC